MKSPLCLTVLTVLLTASLVWPRTDLAPVSTATREGRLAVFDDVWTTIDERYYDTAFHGVDWNAQRVKFRELAANTNSARDLYVVLRQMLSQLNDPHTRVFSPEERFDWWRPRFVTIGLSLKEVDGLPTVVRVDSQSPADRAGLRPGDVIDSVNGQSVESLIAQRLAISGSGKAGRERIFATLLDGAAGTPVELVWKGKHNRKRQATLVRYWAQRDLGVKAKRLANNYLTIEIEAFTRPIAIAFRQLFNATLARSRGVVIDLRMNGGGDAEAMAEIASTFLGAGIDMGTFTDRAGAGFSVLTSFTATRSLAVQVPIVLVTSERTSSAAEIFVAALRKQRSVTVVGTQTCGCVLAIRNRHELPDGGVLDISELNYKTPLGERLEGNGVEPDHAVVVHRQDLYAKRDPAMTLALSILQSIR